jgi:hypothetical protein
MRDGEVLLADTATVLGPRFDGAVVICGSHGGAFPGCLVARAGCRGAIFNDAAIGLQAAGIGSLKLLEGLGVPGATVDHRSARIGDAADMQVRGIISRVNRSAESIGCAVGQTVADCAKRMSLGTPRVSSAPDITEQRVLVAEGSGVKVWALDSASQVMPDDADAILLTGSHGGLVGGRSSAVLKTNARLAVFNDAGVGVDRAGIGRLAVLSERGIAAATVSAETARIGDGVSTYEEGIISYLNEPAQSLGGRQGQAVREFVTGLLDRVSSEAAC